MNLSTTTTSLYEVEDEFLLHDDDSETLPARIALSGWLGFVAVVGFLGNLLIVIVIVMYPKLQTVTNVYVTSLAVADMMTCLSIPFMIIGIVSTTGWPMSEASCVVLAIVSFVCYGASVWHLAIIGFNRMVLITMSSSTYRKIFSKLNVAAYLVITWLIPLSVILIPFLSGFTRLGYDNGPHMCTDIEENEDGSENPIHSYLQATFLTCFPLAIVLLFYARIYLHVRKHQRTQNMWRNTPSTAAAPANQSLTPPDASRNEDLSTSQPVAMSGNVSVNPTAATRPNKNTGQRSLEYRITKNAFYVVLGFLLCVIPYGVCILGKYGPSGTPLGMAFLLFNSCLNPLIYGTKHPQFKASMKNIFTARFRAPLIVSNAVAPTDQ